MMYNSNLRVNMEKLYGMCVIKYFDKALVLLHSTTKIQRTKWYDNQVKSY